jgi:hypothetical protein
MPSEVMMCIILLKFPIQNWDWTKDKPRERCILSKENLDIGICLETSLIDSFVCVGSSMGNVKKLTTYYSEIIKVTNLKSWLSVESSASRM